LLAGARAAGRFTGQRRKGENISTGFHLQKRRAGGRFSDAARTGSAIIPEP